MVFKDEYVGTVKATADRSEKLDHQILEIVKPKLRTKNADSFKPIDFRLPDTVQNHMYYQYEILATFYVYVESNGTHQLVLQVDITDAAQLDDDAKLKDLFLDALDFYVKGELKLGQGIEFAGKEHITSVVRGLNLS